MNNSGFILISSTPDVAGTMRETKSLRPFL
jgi:hypothetical protein